MGLESGTYIDDLSVSNPTTSDGVSQGDDHLRLIKTVLKNTFPNATKAFRFPTISSKAASFNATNDNTFFPVDASSGAVTASLPAGSGLGSGHECTVVKTDGSSNAVTVSPDGSDTINGRTSYVFNSPYGGAVFVWTGSLWIVKPFGQDSLFETGDVLWGLTSSSRTGWIKLNATTIGSASSGAGQRANADCERLFNYLWDNLSDNVCAVSSGRGASAAADWSANKTIATPDMRGRGPFGLDTMGGSAAGVISDATVTGGDNDSDTPGGTGGAEDHTLTTDEMPTHSHGVTDPGHTHDFDYISTQQNNLNDGSSDYAANQTNRSGTTDSATTGITIDNAGGGSAHNNMPPFILGTWFMKL